MSVTLKDVAEKLGVTITTVHKALNGKEGVSEKRRAEIMKVAAQMGYKVNYMASSLSKKKFHIAVVLPNTDGDNRFYYGALWDGIRNYLDTVSEFPITVSEYAYPLTRDGNGLVLEKIFNQDSDDLQGLITIAMDHDRSSYFLEKFAKKQIPVVLIGADLHTDFRLCCIKANDTAVGYLAAELLTAFLPSGYPAKILMAGDYGCLGMEDQRLNMQAFSAYLHTYAPSIETVGPSGYLCHLYLQCPFYLPYFPMHPTVRNPGPYPGHRQRSFHRKPSGAVRWHPAWSDRQKNLQAKRSCRKDPV